ncbi:targeting protein for Xklp2 homolog [Asterias rubens]|uniref:targeting protein for Xklp2 homolog n=1 Tax=Asterias rubens TaxID=7604 RepID=UPI0014557F62|nr:targeting protein for Xklp2 homolog [Asterias rubens]
MADKHYVDDLYEMDCPKFVDFNVPQDMNDNADEWFNFDHENGIPIKFEDETTVCSSDGAKEKATESSSEEMSIDKSDADSASAPESSSGLGMLSSGPEIVSSGSEILSSGPENLSSDPEEPTAASSSEKVSSSEMSADSLEVSDSLETKTVEKSTRQDRSIGRERKRSHVKKPVIEAAPRPTARTSPRLHVRRSADAVRTKRSSTSQATKRRSANPGLSHQQRGRASPSDPSIHKRRKMGNESMISPTGKKVSCPKLKTKLTLATTPTLLKHNFGKAVQAKSTVQLEMEKIEHFRQELAAKRKQSQQSFKAVKESAPHLPVRSSTKATKAEAFKFETDSRLKSHPMETRNDARTPNFQGNLRKYSPSSNANHGPTRPKEFHLSENQRKRSYNESMAGERKTPEFRSMALAINQFQTRTPERFRTKPIAEQNKGPEPAADKPKRKRLTHPKTPALESRNRHRPVTAVSRTQQEELEVADMRNYKFKARPVDPRVYSDVSMGVKTVTHKEATKSEGFHFETDKRLLQREASKVHSESHYEFRARPLPAKILAGPVGIADAKPHPVTLPKSPAFALKNRMRIYEEREKEKEKESELENTTLSRARPANLSVAPFIPTIQHKKTEVEPFSFDDKIRETKARKEAKMQELLLEEEKARKFQAQPMPYGNLTGIPVKQVKPPTQSAPFTVAEKGAKQAEEWRKKMEEEVRECKQLASAFKANPANILYEEPFIPEKSAKPMTDISNFKLYTERRAEERKDFEQRKFDRQCDMEAALAQRETEKQEEERNEINKIRAERVHKANPIRQYRTVEVLPSTKLLTQATTPKFSDRTRHTVSHV